MHIIFAIHGARSKYKNNWVFDFLKFAKKDSRFKNDIFFPYAYGFMPAVLSVNPFFILSAMVRCD